MMLILVIVLIGGMASAEGGEQLSISKLPFTSYKVCTPPTPPYE